MPRGADAPEARRRKTSGKGVPRGALFACDVVTIRGGRGGTSGRGEAGGAQMRGFPPVRRGMSVGGFSAARSDPPHEGHAHITREALKRFGLDEVWWLVSPGNPLKARGPAPLPGAYGRRRGGDGPPTGCGSRTSRRGSARATPPGRSTRSARGMPV